MQPPSLHAAGEVERAVTVRALTPPRLTLHPPADVLPPAGGAAAGSVSTAACFAAPVLTAGRSHSLSLLSSPSCSFPPPDLLSLTILSLSLFAHGRRRVPHSLG